MRTVLVTGGNGFTGVHLSRHLNDHGYKTVKLGRVGSEPSSSVIDCDLLDQAALTSLVSRVQPDFVIHLAGLSFAAHPNPSELFEVNLFGTENLLEAIKMSGAPVAKIILASSANVYGNPKTETVKETLCPAPVNYYASSKLAMEHMAKTWFDRLPILIVRPFNYTGKDQSSKFLIPKIVEHFTSSKTEIELGNLDVARDISDVRTICNAYRLLIECDSRSEIINVCSGSLYSLRDILNLVGNITNRKLSVQVNSALVRENEIKRLRGSNEKLHNIIGVQKYIDLPETLKWMIDQNNMVN